MTVNGVTLPDLPSTFHNAACKLIMKINMVEEDASITSYVAVGADRQYVHAPKSMVEELVGEPYDMVVCTGTPVGGWNLNESGNGWDAVDGSETVMLPIISVMGMGFSLFWSNHYIMTVESADLETGDFTLSDEVYFAASEHTGKPEYGVPSELILAAANVVRLLGPKNMHTTDTMYDFMTSEACGWMEKIVIPGRSVDPLIALAMMSTGITSYAEKIEIFPFTLNMLTPTVNLPNATELGYNALGGLLILKEVNAPKLEKIGDLALQLCALTAADFPLVTDVGEDAFSGADDLITASLPVAVRIGADAFEGCTALTSFAIPATVKYLGKKGEHANPFPGCTALTTITVDSGNENYVGVNGREVYSKDLTVLVIPAIGAESYAVTDGVKSIARSAFSGDVNLKSISIPSSVEYIGNEAFGNCDALVKLDIPATVTEIGSSITTGCDAMTTLILRKSDAAYSELPYFPQMAKGTGYAYVPSALLAAYKELTSYDDQIRAIEDYPEICG